MSLLLLFGGAGGAAVPVAATPTMSLRVAPGSNAGDLNPSWTEIGPLLRSFTYARGQQTELDQPETGTAQIVVDNSTRVLDPSYTVGPFYGDLTPGMQVSLRETLGGVTKDLFRGHVERFSTAYQGPNVAVTTLECTDRLGALQAMTLTGTFGEQATGARITSVISSMGWPTSAVTSGWTLDTSLLGSTTILAAIVPTNNIDTGRATVASATFAATSTPAAHIQQVALSEPGRFFFDGAGTATFKDRSHVLPVADASVVTFTDSPTAGDATHVPYKDIVLNYDINRVGNDVQLTFADGTSIGYQDAVSIDRYFRRTLPRATQLRTGDPDAWQQVFWWLSQRKDARLRVEEVTVAAWTDLGFAALLNVEIGNHVTVLRTPPGATSELLTQESIVEKVTVMGSPGPVWTFKYALSPIVAQPATGWILGTSALDTNTTLIYS